MIAPPIARAPTPGAQPAPRARAIPAPRPPTRPTGTDLAYSLAGDRPTDRQTDRPFSQSFHGHRRQHSHAATQQSQEHSHEYVSPTDGRDRNGPRSVRRSAGRLEIGQYHNNNIVLFIILQILYKPLQFSTCRVDDNIVVGRKKSSTIIWVPMSRVVDENVVFSNGVFFFSTLSLTRYYRKIRFVYSKTFNLDLNNIIYLELGF